MEQGEAPPVVAVFVVIFDQKVGYTVAWKRNLPDVEVYGVEYKSLPSGLHGVKSDVVYFIQNQYAGVSAFAQEEADEQHRNASFVAVGALVSHSHGRLGRSWLHAAELRQYAKDLVKDTLKGGHDTRALELFWRKYRQDNANSDRRDSRQRKLSDSSHGLMLDTGGVADHPALYMPTLLDTFGPLLFPLYRAALCRKRILLLGTPPVQRSCNAVYTLSVLSSIPQDVSEALQPDVEPLLRSQPLFSIGVPDISSLSAGKSKAGWIATTTDDILGEKHQLWNILVDLAPNEPGSRRRWPKMRTSDGKVIRATQRDLRRYRQLRGELKRIHSVRKRYRDDAEQAETQEEDEQEPLMHSSTMLNEPTDPEDMRNGESEVVEPVSWTAMAYDSFMWWASAGEQDAWVKEEMHADRQLLDDLPSIGNAGAQPPAGSEEDEELFEAQETATVLTAYFHRLTAQIVRALAEAVEEADDETEEGIEEDAIEVTVDEVRQMGLDTWSASDREFVKQVMRLYFGREAVVAEGGLKICGLKIC